MTLYLTRESFRKDGVFGVLKSVSSEILAHTLEHAYLQEDGSYLPKVPDGAYACIRRHSPRFGYDVFMLTGVPGHDFIEIHVGNFNRNSDGCILLGDKKQEAGGIEMITDSRKTFARFMSSMDGIDRLDLVVS